MNEAQSGPNYLTTASQHAEKLMGDLLSQADVIDVKAIELERSDKEITDIVRKYSPERYDLVTTKLREDGRSLSSLSKGELLDRMLGVDFLIRFKGEKIAIDVTSGKGSVLYNKRKKMESLAPAFRSLGINHSVVVRVKQQLSEDLILELFSQVEDLIVKNNEFCAVINIKADEQSRTEDEKSNTKRKQPSRKRV